MDRNGDGLVSRAELEEWMHAKDGNLRFIEQVRRRTPPLLAVASPPCVLTSRARQMLSGLDTDGDGHISKEEFEALAY